MNLFQDFFFLLTLINIILAFSLVFIERKNPTSTLAWMMVLLFIPGLGFILYLFFGQNLHKTKMFTLKKSEDKILKQIILRQENELENRRMNFYDTSLAEYEDIIRMHLKSNDSFFTQNNDVEVFVDGHEKFDSLIHDIENAKKHIHLLYYIFKEDGIGKRIMELLKEKLKSGVRIKLLYDGMGSSNISEEFFEEYIKLGGQVSCFFPIRVPKFQFRLNFRNHRKIAVIDGHIAYVGGFNIGDEYLGLDKKYGYWRDTHIRITGEAVYSLQIRFLMDWNYSSSEKVKVFDSGSETAKLIKAEYDESELFPNIAVGGKAGIQIVSSGPDSESEQIKHGYLKLINNARKSIFIQSPYFIPDESIIESLKIAALSGVDVRLMIPNRPDHPFVYWATLSHAASLIKSGVKLYRYEKGFLHSKTIVADAKLCSIGTANWDVRSFKLNFEVNSFIYDRKISQKLHEIYLNDLKCCTQITQEIYDRRSKKVVFKESFSRLLSSLL